MGLKRRVKLRANKSFDLEYNNTVYSPHYSSLDTVVLADFIAKAGDHVLDISCGSGITGLSLKYLRYDVNVSLCDISQDAVSMTEHNAVKIGKNVKVFQSDLFSNVTDKYDIIIANLPTYTSDDMKQELHGPKDTYFADKTDGLKLYERFFTEAKEYLNTGGCLICECQEKLQDDFEKLAYNKGYKLAVKNDYGFLFYL